MTAVDRTHRIVSPEHVTANPDRIVVVGCWPVHLWRVYRGFDLLGRFDTHAEAIAAADQIARGESAVDTQYIAPNRPNPQSIEPLAEITADLDAVDARWGDYVGTHYEACWKHHAQCLATRLRARIDDHEERP